MIFGGVFVETQNIKEIISLIKSRNSLGFDLLYKHYFRFMFSVAYSVLNNEEDCYDVIQTLMLRLLKLDESLFPTDHELSWLRTVIKNEALMKLRKEKQTVPLDDEIEIPVQDKRIEDFVDMEQFKALIAPLNERQRKVVTMKILGDMTHKEISKVLSVPIGTVQWLYNTSIKELRRIMTALSAFVLFCGGGMAYQIISSLHTEETPGDFGISSVPLEEPALSPWLPISIGLFVLVTAALIIFYNFSDRLPTKRFTRRIYNMKPQNRR